MFCKGFQQLKLTGAEIYFLFSPRNTAGLQVDLKVADLQNNIFLLWHLSAKDGLARVPPTPANQMALRDNRKRLVQTHADGP